MSLRKGKFKARSRVNLYLRDGTSDKLLDWINSQANINSSIMDILEDYANGNIMYASVLLKKLATQKNNDTSEDENIVYADERLEKRNIEEIIESERTNNDDYITRKEKDTSKQEVDKRISEEIVTNERTISEIVNTDSRSEENKTEEKLEKNPNAKKRSKRKVHFKGTGIGTDNEANKQIKENVTKKNDVPKERYKEGIEPPSRFNKKE